MAQECIIHILRRLKEGKQKKALKGIAPWKHISLWNTALRLSPASYCKWASPQLPHWSARMIWRLILELYSCNFLSSTYFTMSLAKMNLIPPNSPSSFLLETRFGVGLRTKPSIIRCRLGNEVFSIFEWFPGAFNKTQIRQKKKLLRLEFLIS